MYKQARNCYVKMASSDFLEGECQYEENQMNGNFGAKGHTPTVSGYEVQIIPNYEAHFGVRGADWGSTHREYASCGFREAGSGMPVQDMRADFLEPLGWQNFPELRLRNI